ncbi:uncharacterized protein BYT42DRAFT_561949 [Radiomyces spectabilis]|uniref:uncharacterized protein n=1 Tax=Radiomyces spectabilis TaxID=64574 RepID=UPI00221EFA12|nr:uncharacterized protein BYT42DRAFT_561949 [Radiomyces spectabilis]KAI8384270.1 hypothetical protein BYT42DRAFT_561949 [Radiomyces spectabilis]
MSSTPPKHSLSSPTSGHALGVPVLPTPSSSTSNRTALQQLRGELEQQLVEKEKQLQESQSGIGKNVLARQISQIQERLREMDLQKQDQQDDLPPATLEKLRNLERDLSAYRGYPLSPGLSGHRKEKLLGQRSTGLDGLPSPSASTLMLPSHGHDSSSLLPLPPPPTGSTPTKRRSKVPNTDRRNTDIEFATEIGQGLLVEVRKMQALLQEKEEQLRALEIQKADLERAAEAMAKQLRQREENEEKLKEETWNLELAKQELTISVTELQQNLNKAHTEQNKVVKQLNELRTEIEQLRDREEKLTMAMDNMKQRHEQDMSAIRRHAAGLQREKADQSKQIEALTSELAIAKAQSRIAKHAHAETEPSEKSDSNHGTSDESSTVKNDSAHQSSPPPSPKQKPTRNQALEVETLKTSLAHAHRMVSNLRSNLHKEKTEKFELKKLLAESQETIEQLQNDPRMWIDAGQRNAAKEDATAAGQRRSRKPKRRTPARRARALSRTHRGEDDYSEAENRRKRKNSQYEDDDVYSYSSMSSPEESDVSEDSDHEMEKRVTIAPRFTSLSSELSQSQIKQPVVVDAQVNTDPVEITPLPVPTSIPRSLGDELTSADAKSSLLEDVNSAPETIEPGSDVSTQTEPEPVPVVMTDSRAIQTDSEPSKPFEMVTMDAMQAAPVERPSVDAYVQSVTPDAMERGVQSVPVPTTDAETQSVAVVTLNAEVQSVPAVTSDAGIQSDTMEMVHVATQMDPVTFEDQSTQYESLPGIDHGVQSEQVASMHVGVQSEADDTTSNALENIGVALADVSTAVTVDASVQHDLITPVKDAETQSQAVQVTDAAVQHAIVEEKPEMCDAEVQHWPLTPPLSEVNLEQGWIVNACETVDAGVQPETEPGMDVAVQYDPVQTHDIDVQYEPIQTHDAHVQHDPLETHDADVQYDPVETQDAHVQHDLIDTHDAYVQHEPIETHDVHVQHEPVETHDAHVQQEPVETHDVHVQYEPVPFEWTQTTLEQGWLCKEREAQDVGTQSDVSAFDKQDQERVFVDAAVQHVDQAETRDAVPLAFPATAESTVTSRETKEAVASHDNQPHRADAIGTRTAVAAAAGVAGSSALTAHNESTHASSSHEDRIAAVESVTNSPTISSQADETVQQEGMVHRDIGCDGSVRTREMLPERPTMAAHAVSEPARPDGYRQASHDQRASTDLCSLSTASQSNYDHRPSISSSQLDAVTRGPGGGADPHVISLITQTMIGDWLYKYTRRAVGNGMSEKRHKRFFWIHPYTRTLYWGPRAPGVDGGESKAKSAFIEGVSVVPDYTQTPPGLPNVSLLVQTSTRQIKLTAPTMARHEMWYESLSYLLERAKGESSATVSETKRGVEPRSVARSLSSSLYRKPSLQRLHHLFHSSSGTVRTSLSGSVDHFHDEDLDDEALEDVRMCCNGKHHVSKLEKDASLRPTYRKRKSRPSTLSQTQSQAGSQVGSQ